MNDRIAELRKLIAASQAAHDVCRTRSDVPLRERLAIRDDAAAAMYAAMERDTPALLDCAEALKPFARINLGELYVYGVFADNVFRARNALVRLNGESDAG